MDGLEEADGGGGHAVGPVSHVIGVRLGAVLHQRLARLLRPRQVHQVRQLIDSSTTRTLIT